MKLIFNGCVLVCLVCLVGIEVVQYRQTNSTHAVGMEQNKMIHQQNMAIRETSWTNAQQNEMIESLHRRLGEEVELRILMDTALQAQIDSHVAGKTEYFGVDENGNQEEVTATEYYKRHK